MESINPIEKKIEQAKTQVNYYEQALGTDIDQLKHWWEDKIAVLQRVKRFFTEVLLKRRTLIIIGSAVAVFLIVRALLPGRRRRRAAMQDGSTIVVQQEARQPSFLGSLLRTALKTFLLSYARKVLMQYIDSQMNKATAQTAPKA